MHRIIYFSSATHLLTDNELQLLLEKSRLKNSQNDITGVLIHIDGDVIQVLEGEKEKIQNLYELIKLDPRHSTIIKVFDNEVPSRMFENWSMGYSQETIEDIRKNNNFSSLSMSELKENKGNIVTVFLETFIKTHQIS